MVGGQIHPDDVDKLKGIGVAGVFGPGTTKQNVLEFLNGLPPLVRA
jgi:methylmalonyl-CoA mutase cobalamin-binding domain/chain